MAEFSIQNRVIHYAEDGQGEAVVLLHGGGSSSRQWGALSKAIESQFHSVSPDLYGHGASSAWTELAPPTLMDYAAIVEKIRDFVGEPFHLVGHSHGGAVAIRYAMQNPQSLQSLTLIEPTLMHLLRVLGNPAWPEAEELGTKHIIAVSQGRSAEIADAFLPYWIGETAWQNMPSNRREAIIQTMPAVAQFWASEFAEETPAEAYSQIAAPTLLVRGTETRTTAKEIVSLLFELLPDARLIEIAGAGHMAPSTHANDVNEAITRHITANSVMPSSQCTGPFAVRQGHGNSAICQGNCASPLRADCVEKLGVRTEAAKLG